MQPSERKIFANNKSYGRLISKIHKELIWLNIKGKKKKLRLKNGQRIWIDIFPKGQTDDQQTHKNMLNIINHQKNENQNHKDIISHLSAQLLWMNNKWQQMVRTWSKGNPWSRLVECKLVQLLWKAVQRCLKIFKLNNHMA